MKYSGIASVTRRLIPNPYSIPNPHPNLSTGTETIMCYFHYNISNSSFIKINAHNNYYTKPQYS